jgi:alkylation response protein AidB-like acyl-CoA dehydrogenase
VQETLGFRCCPEAYGGMEWVCKTRFFGLYIGATGSFSLLWSTQELELCQSHYTEQATKQNVPKLASGDGLVLISTEPGAGSDANSGKQKLFCLKMETSITGKKWISNAGFCSVFIVFCTYWMIKYYWFYRRKH